MPEMCYCPIPNTSWVCQVCAYTCAFKGTHRNSGFSTIPLLGGLQSLCKNVGIQRVKQRDRTLDLKKNKLNMHKQQAFSRNKGVTRQKADGIIAIISWGVNE